MMRYTYVKQHDATDCAATCLAMVCLHYRKETTITKLRDIMGTDLKGTKLLGLDKCAADRGDTEGMFCAWRTLCTGCFFIGSTNWK